MVNTQKVRLMSTNKRKTIFGILKLVPLAMVTAMLIMLWCQPFLVAMVLAWFWYITLAVIILSVVFTAMSLRRRDGWQRTTFIWGMVNLLILLCFLFIKIPNSNCSPEKMARHYEKHKTEMDALLDYATSAVDDSAYVFIRWDGDEKTIFHVKGADGVLSQHWDDAEAKQDSLMKVVGLNSEQLEEIHHRLKAMNCIGIMVPSSHEYICIEYRSVVFAVYSYNIYRSPLTAEQRDKVMADPVFIPYNERVSFVFEGGAVGADSFGQERKNSYLEKHKPW